MKKLILALTLSLFCLNAYADLALDNAKAGKKYLDDNKKKHQVVALNDGLQYKILIPGKDKTNKPTDGSEVTVEYTGKLINGTVFDSTDNHGGSATFPIDGVIPGWTEVLKLMPVGSTWEVYIPANLAYGEKAPDSIGPNQTLIFKIKLISFKKA